jgi:hypothetical protein
MEVGAGSVVEACTESIAGFGTKEISGSVTDVSAEVGAGSVAEAKGLGLGGAGLVGFTVLGLEF